MTDNTDILPPRWRYYFRALSGDFSGWDTEEAPYPGFYRYRQGDRFIGVAIFDLEGKPSAALHGYPPVSWESLMLWDRCYRYPIPESRYREYEQSGRWWDDLTAVANHGASTTRDLRTAAPLGPLPKAGRFS